MAAKVGRAEHQPDYCPMCQAPDPRRVRDVWFLHYEINLEEWECHTDGDEERQGCGYRFWTEAKDAATEAKVSPWVWMRHTRDVDGRRPLGSVSYLHLFLRDLSSGLPACAAFVTGKWEEVKGPRITAKGHHFNVEDTFCPWCVGIAEDEKGK